MFVGAFDTVKAVEDRSLYDISFNDSIKHMRHALALNEDRKMMQPEYIYPNFANRTSSLLKRSFIQAWFVGAHIDMGGSSKSDGLSLYPLQWMLIESRNAGLCLEFDGTYGGRSSLIDPLRVVGLNDPDVAQWSCTLENKLKVQMYDIREVHNLEGRYKARYGVQLNASKPSVLLRKVRQPFDNEGKLNGYCSFCEFILEAPTRPASG
jgi:hypothetical protein